MRLLFITYEPWPTHRPDVVTLFGKYLRRSGIHTDLVAEAAECGPAAPSTWAGGRLISCQRPARRPAQHLAKLWLNLSSAFGVKRAHYDCVQVRDMSLSALAGLLAARLRGVKFVYWLSFLQSEGHIARAQARGPGAGLKYWYPLLEGMAGRYIVYKLVLPRADHVFVQSEAMKSWLAAKGVPAAKMTAVPMGVDMEDSEAIPLTLPDNPALQGRRTLIYLGTQDRVRQIEVLLDMLAIVKAEVPNTLLIMAGDTDDAEYRGFLRERARSLGIEDNILWTGWISRTEAWKYVRAAEIGLSPIPRGTLFDVSSPTKAVEYMALGIPVVGNDNPDQQQVIDASGAGICTPLTGADFAQAVVTLLRDDQQRLAMGARGPSYVRSCRSYAHLSAQLTGIYEDVCEITLAPAKESLPV